jgi:hypothetical protein
MKNYSSPQEYEKLLITTNIRKLQIETTSRNHLIPVRMAIMKKTKSNN